MRFNFRSISDMIPLKFVRPVTPHSNAMLVPRRAGRLASPPAVEWRIHRALLRDFRHGGNCQGAQEPAGSLLQAVAPCVASVSRDRDLEIGRSAASGPHAQSPSGRPAGSLATTPR